MTDKLYCPFCGAELCTDNIEFYYCTTAHCALWECEGVPQKVIKALIDGKKAQEILKGIKRRVVAIRSCVQDGYTQLGERNRNIFIALELFKDLIKEITSITKQEE